MPGSLWWTRLSNENIVENYVPRGFLQKDENQGWDLFEDLVEKTIQWELSPEKPRSSQFIASRGGLLSIESSAALEAKIVTFMRRIEVLETKEPVVANQIIPSQLHNPSCTYCLASNHVFEESPYSKLTKHHRNIWMRPTQGCKITPTYKLTILDGKVTQTSPGARTMPWDLTSQ